MILTPALLGPLEVEMLHGSHEFHQSKTGEKHWQTKMERLHLTLIILSSLRPTQIFHLERLLIAALELDSLIAETVGQTARASGSNDPASVLFRGPRTSTARRTVSGTRCPPAPRPLPGPHGRRGR